MKGRAFALIGGQHVNRKNTLVRLAPIVVIVLIIALSVSSHAETINESGIMYTDKAGDFICKLGGRYYYKATDGWAIAAYFYCSSGYSGPILVSDKEENVSYYTSYDNSVFQSIGTVVFDEKTYYYSAIKYFMYGNYDNESDNGLYKCGGGEATPVEDAALEILIKYFAVCVGSFSSHEYFDTVIELEATCSTEGFGTRECMRCGIVEETVIDKLPHNYSDWDVEKEATCKEEGKRTRVCNDCGEPDEEAIESINHRYGDWVIVSGSKLIPPIVKEKTCSLCGDVVSSKDWSYVWVSFVAVIAAVGVIIGVANYIKNLKKVS